MFSYQNYMYFESGYEAITTKSVNRVYEGGTIFFA